MTARDGTAPMAGNRRPSIRPSTEAGALVREWADQFRRTDTAWREVYTENELRAVDAALDALLAKMPHPGRSLVFRLRAQERIDG